MYMWKAFVTLKGATNFKKKHGGVLYDLNKERKKMEKGKHSSAVALYCGVNPKFNYAVEWNTH